MPPSRIELNRQRSTLGNAWEAYQRTFIRTGSFMPIFHVLGGLTVLQCTVWAVQGMPDEVNHGLFLCALRASMCRADSLAWLRQVRQLYEGNTAIRTGKPRDPNKAPNAEH